MTALVGSAALAADAPAAVDPEIGVRPGHNVSVFHAIDMVAGFGHEVGRPLTIEVFRAGHRIGRAAGRALVTPEGGGLEVNHGPVGLPLPGDCWEQRTPDIRPFDRVVVTDADGAQDAVLVDDIGFDAGQPTYDAVSGEVSLTGHARTALGEPIPAATLEGEFRLTSRLRGGPARIETTGDGGFRAVYERPYFMERNREGRSEEEIRLALLDPAAEHTVGFGHLNPFATGETQIADLGGIPGPAPGCEAAPAAGGNAASATDDDLVGPASGDLVVGGTALPGVTEVALAVSDGVTTITRTTAELAAAQGAPADGDRAWSMTIDRAALEAFAPEATLTLTPSFTGAEPATAGALQVRKDLGAPAAPTADVPAGRHVSAPRVRLSSEPGARIFFTVDGATPTTASPRYVGPIAIEADTTLQAIALDAAGNVSGVAAYTYLVGPAPRPPAPAPPAGGGAPAPAPPALPAPPVGLTPGPAPQAPATRSATRRLRVTRASVRPRRMTVRTARRRGVVARFVAPRGAAVVRAVLVRRSGSRRVVVARKAIVARPGRRQAARFTGAKVRRKLRPGRYVVEIRPRGVRPAATVGATLRIVR